MGEKSRSGVLSGVSKNPQVFEMCGHHSCNYRERSVALLPLLSLLPSGNFNQHSSPHSSKCLRLYNTLCQYFPFNSAFNPILFCKTFFFLSFFRCILLKDLFVPFLKYKIKTFRSKITFFHFLPHF